MSPPPYLVMGGPFSVSDRPTPRHHQSLTHCTPTNPAAWAGTATAFSRCGKTTSIGPCPVARLSLLPLPARTPPPRLAQSGPAMADRKRARLAPVLGAMAATGAPPALPAAAGGPLPAKLVQSIKDGDCVVFVGAGFSAPARLPSWTRLLEILVDELCGTDAANPKRSALRKLMGYDAAGKWVGGQSSDALDQCAQCVEDDLGEDRVHELIAQALKLPEPLNPAMQARRDLLVSIPFRAILTTNYDDILPGIAAETPEAKRLMRDILRGPQRPFEQFLATSEVGVDNAGSGSGGPSSGALGSGGPSSGGGSNGNHAHAPQTPGAPPGRPYQLGRSDRRNWGPTLRLHGAVGNVGRGVGGPILSRKGYRRLLRGNEAYQHFLSAVMAAKTILYIGFSFTDYYINELRRSVVDMLGEFRDDDAPVAYAIVNDMDDAKRAFYRRHEGVEVLTFDTTGGDWSGFERILSSIRDQTNPSRLYADTLRRKRILYVTRAFDAPAPSGSSSAAVASASSSGGGGDAGGEARASGASGADSWWFKEKAWNDGERLAKFLQAASKHLPEAERVVVEVLTDHCDTIVASAMARLQKANAAGRPFDLVISDHGSAQYGLVAAPLLTAMHSSSQKVPLVVHGGPVPGRKEAIIRRGAIDYTHRWESLFGCIQKLLAPAEGTM